MKHTIAIVVPYFGPLPNYFDLWLLSAAHNVSIDWLIFTDQPIIAPSSNIKVVDATLAQVRDRLEAASGVTPAIHNPYKLCDFRPVYGEAFSDCLQGYSFWGHADIDVIWGRLRQYLTDDILDTHSKVFGGGHLSLYRNTPTNNRTYRLTVSSNPLSYSDVFTDPRAYAFDEWGPNRNGMNAIYLESGLPFYLETMPYADIKVHSRALRNHREGFGGSAQRASERAKRNIAYSFHDGVLEQHWLDDRGRALTREEAYIHLQKRPINRKALEQYSSKFIILPPNEIRPLEEPITARYLRTNSRVVGWYGHSFGLRLRNLRNRMRLYLDR